MPKKHYAGNRKTLCSAGGIFCALFVYEDCRKEDGTAEQEGAGEDALFCTLCNSEVRKFSKHCRSCDKCVDGFDHHCRIKDGFAEGKDLVVGVMSAERNREEQICALKDIGPK